MGRGGRENNVRRGLKALWVAELEQGIWIWIELLIAEGFLFRAGGAL